jgi:DNA polymerase
MEFSQDDVFIDHESFSEIDLKKSGSYAYAEHKSTEIMLTTYAFGDEAVQCYDATDGGRLPSELRSVLKYQSL